MPESSSPPPPPRIDYSLELRETTASAGYFACRPVDPPAWQDALAHIADHPLDDFMRLYLLDKISAFDLQHLSDLIATTSRAKTALRALWYEACLLYEPFHELQSCFDADEREALMSATGLIYIKSSLDADRALHRQWMPLVHANHYAHQPLPDPTTIDRQHPFPPEKLQKSLQFDRHLTETIDISHSKPSHLTSPSPATTAALALDKLSQAGVLVGEEMRHISSLSLYGLLHKWRFNLSIATGRHTYGFSGTQTAYGRGLSLEAARASYAMEIVERCSAFAGFDGLKISGYANDYPLIKATYDELRHTNRRALDPNRLSLETPYRNEPLYWMNGQIRTAQGLEPLLIPCQCVFLFSNLDEVSLFSGLGSTGLASGNTLAQAKLNALLELIERDSEAVHPFHPSRCFLITADDPQIAALLEDYWLRGIHIAFQDISPPFGVPCCQCFVVGLDGQIHKGAGAHLDGRRCVLSALTETPYPYPYGPPSRPITHDLPVLRFEDLPDFASGDCEQDLMLLEETLIANNLNPHYVDLTREDLDIPVVRAIVPGLEMLTDFDTCSRVSPRYFANYLKLYKNINGATARREQT